MCFVYMKPSFFHLQHNYVKINVSIIQDYTIASDFSENKVVDKNIQYKSTAHIWMQIS